VHHADELWLVVRAGAWYRDHRHCEECLRPQEAGGRQDALDRYHEKGDKLEVNWCSVRYVVS
jgi:hypothetical protein